MDGQLKVTFLYMTHLKLEVGISFLESLHILMRIRDGLKLYITFVYECFQ